MNVRKRQFTQVAYTVGATGNFDIVVQVPDLSLCDLLPYNL